MKINELTVNEMEQVSGGNIFQDVMRILKQVIPNPFGPDRPVDPIIPHPVIASEH